MRRWSVLVCGIGSLALVAGGCADSSSQRAGGERASASPRPVASDAGARDYAVRDALTAMGPDTASYHNHAFTLSNTYFEGRDPGMIGNQRAAEYLAEKFADIGLEPFVTTRGAPDARDPLAAEAVNGRSYFHTFFVNDTVVARQESMRVAGRTMKPGVEFAALGISESGSVTGEPVFVGYSIADGPNGYNSFGEDDDLTGKIAVMFRFEPMGPDGESLWGRGGAWSRRASFANKINAAVDRGAAGIVVVHPVMCADPRAQSLPRTHEVSTGRAGVPIVVVSAQASDEFFSLIDGERRTALQLRRIADKLGAGERGVIPMSSGGSISISVELERPEVATWNVAGLLPGKGGLAREYVVVGAHFDHLGLGFYGSRSPDRAGTIHPGADDNASGTAGVIVAAEILTRRYDAMPANADARSVLFVGFSAEEMGLIGSREFVGLEEITSDSTYAMINLDMIGRLRDDNLEISGVGTAEDWTDVLTQANRSHGLNIDFDRGGVGPSDHANFYRDQIPAVHFFSGLHRDYHTDRDTPELLNIRGGAKISAYAADAVELLATRRAPFTFQTTQNPGQGGMANVSVRLGVAPGNYGEEGQGVLIGDVFEGTSADKGGIKAGDVLVKWGDKDVTSVVSMMERLSEHEPGDKVTVIVERDGKRVPLNIELQGRGGGG
ncbi:MAG: M28 family peptidase [Planctomycetota bacterium]